MLTKIKEYFEDLKFKLMFYISANIKPHPPFKVSDKQKNSWKDMNNNCNNKRKTKNSMKKGDNYEH